jgi:hypothetical protein
VATSQWVAFNIEKRKMARIPASVTEDFKAQALPDSPVMGPEYTVWEHLLPLLGQTCNRKIIKLSIERRDDCTVQCDM